MSDSKGLRFTDPRSDVLADLAHEVGQLWSSFDHSRNFEPGLTTEAQDLLALGLPDQGVGERKAIGDSLTLLDQSAAQSRPRYLAYIGASGLEIGAIADFLASSFDINLAAKAGAATSLERQTARWVAEFIGYRGGEGLFTSGGTVSNMTAMLAARTKAMPTSRKQGITEPMAVYCSKEAHYSNVRAVEAMGLGSNAVRSIAIDENHRLIPAEFEAAVKTDIAAGIKPMAVIASAGTTLTGAVDPLRAIAEICRKYEIWMHIDGAYGAPAAGTSKVGNLFDGLDMADSLTIDLHKWMFVPKACSVLLVKDLGRLNATFSHNEAYMPHDSADFNPVDLTLEYSRPVRALKMWMGFYTHGAQSFREAITGGLELADLTYDRASKLAHFRVLPNRPQLSIVPIQIRPDGVTDVSAHNRLLCQEIVRDGRVYMSPAEIDGETWLRPCFVNFRTTKEDVDVMFGVIEELSAKLIRQ